MLLDNESDKSSVNLTVVSRKGAASRCLGAERRAVRGRNGRRVEEAGVRSGVRSALGRWGRGRAPGARACHALPGRRSGHQHAKVIVFLQ